MPKQPLPTLIRAGLTGLGYALAVGGAGLWLNIRFVLGNRIAPPLEFFTKSTLLSLLLGAAIGMAAAPLLACRRGRGWHLVAVAAIWACLEMYAAPDSAMVRRVTLIGPAAAFLLVLLGRWIARRWRWAPVPLGVGLLLSGVFVPRRTPHRWPSCIMMRTPISRSCEDKASR